MNATTTSNDRIANRAPKGGMVSTVNGRFYKGGQFMPTIPAIAFELRPVKLMGSFRQVAWANRLRAEKLADVEGRMADLLHEIGKKKGVSTLVAAYSYRELADARQMLCLEPEAAVIIDAFRA